MPHEKCEWALSMIVVNVVFQCMGINKPNKCRLVVNRNTSIKDLKQHLQASKSIVGTVSLNDEELNDVNATLRNCGVENGAQLSVRSYTPRRKLTHSIRVKVVDKEPFMVKVAPRTKFSELAHMVQDECWMPVEEQVWYKKGKVLKMSRYRDSPALDHYDHITKDPLVVKWAPRMQVQTDRPMHHRKDVTEIQQNTCVAAIPKEEVLMSIPCPNNVPTRNGLVEISRDMKHWKCYADRLNISKAKQIEIENDHHEFSEQKFQLLKTWKQQEGRQATWKVFISACVDLNDHHLRDKALDLSRVQDMSTPSFLRSTSSEEP